MEEGRAKSYDALRGLIQQLGLAGLALVWIFKLGDSSKPTLNGPLFLAAGMLTSAVGIDFLNRFYEAWTSLWLARHANRIFDSAQEGRSLPRVLRIADTVNPAVIMVFVSAVALIVGYGVLISYLLGSGIRVLRG